MIDSQRRVIVAPALLPWAAHKAGLSDDVASNQAALNAN
jgi:hypothetical protein